MYDTLVERVQSFYAAHEHWGFEKFWSCTDSSMRSCIQSAIEADKDVLHLLQCGKEDEMADFYTRLKTEFPMMSTAVLKGVLDKLYSQQQLQESFSQSAVLWFRHMGWKFPEFEFEKEITKSDSYTTKITVLKSEE